MPKEYKVSGQSKTAPKDLPEGLTVEEIHVDGVATSLFGTTFRVREYADDLISLDIKAESDMGTKTTKLLSQEEAAKLHEALGELLKPTLRAFRDREWDFENPRCAWYEVSPDRFIFGSDRSSAEGTGQAVPMAGRTLDSLTTVWGPLTEHKE